MKFTVIDQDGAEHALEGADGLPLMEIIHASGLEIAAQCGGSAACATCHVYVDSAWTDRLPQPEEMEASMLEMAEDVDEQSRLSCQITATHVHDGLRITLAPGTRV
ncbi:MAG: 2Fe-2S iron-sulfur cluster-binding protein [Pseudomonadota bacterium]|nr:2Fe-2S iron-sulfur cluster-binding protein [Pseudomonadota bacterium]